MHIKDRAEELQITIDYLDAGQIRQLRQQSRQMVKDTEDEAVRTSVLTEIDSLIEVSE